MSRTVKYKKAIAKIQLDEGVTWEFPLARMVIENHYWSWVRFELDKDLERGMWTLIIEPHGDIASADQGLLATIFFAVESAPQEFLTVGNKFELFCGCVENVKANGEIVEASDAQYQR